VLLERRSVGDDVFGQFIIDTLSRGGVGVGGVHKAEGINTASTMVINVRGEDRRFISSPGANHRFTVDHVPPAWIEQAKVLYVGGYLMLPGLENEGALEWFRSARASGTKTVLDVVYLGGEGCRRAVELLLPETDYFLPNEDEAAVLTGRRAAPGRGLPDRAGRRHRGGRRLRRRTDDGASGR